MSVRASIAHECLQTYPTYNTLNEALVGFIQEYKGKIVQIKMTKLAKGVSETILYKFPDSTRIKITRFILDSGHVNISVKRDD